MFIRRLGIISIIVLIISVMVSPGWTYGKQNSEYMEIKQILERSVEPEDFFQYEINTDGINTCTITGYNSTVYTNIIPGVIGGYTVTRIGNGAFKGKKQISGEIALPNTIISIGNEAFYECTNLSIIRLGQSLKSIGNSAFLGCNYLKTIRFNNSLENIGDRAFYRCTMLKGATLSFPESLKSIESAAFYGIENLTLSFNSINAPTITGNTFDGCKDLVISHPFAGVNYTEEKYWPTEKILIQSVLKGDLNLDKLVDSTDAAIALTKYRSNNSTSKDLSLGDMNGDGILDSIDAAIILTNYKRN